MHLSGIQTDRAYCLKCDTIGRKHEIDYDIFEEFRSFELYQTQKIIENKSQSQGKKKFNSCISPFFNSPKTTNGNNIKFSDLIYSLSKTKRRQNNRINSVQVFSQNDIGNSESRYLLRPNSGLSSLNRQVKRIRVKSVQGFRKKTKEQLLEDSLKITKISPRSNTETYNNNKGLTTRAKYNRRSKGINLLLNSILSEKNEKYRTSTSPKDLHIENIDFTRRLSDGTKEKASKMDACTSTEHYGSPTFLSEKRKIVQKVHNNDKERIRIIIPTFQKSKVKGN